MPTNYEYVFEFGTEIINPDQIVGLPEIVFIPNDPMNGDWQRYQQWLQVPNSETPSGLNEPLPPGYQYVSDNQGGIDSTQIIRLPDNFLVTQSDSYNWGVWQTWFAVSWNQDQVKPPVK